MLEELLWLGNDRTASPPGTLWLYFITIIAKKKILEYNFHAVREAAVR